MVLLIVWNLKGIDKFLLFFVVLKKIFFLYWVNFNLVFGDNNKVILVDLFGVRDLMVFVFFRDN